jgi:hypothetical protein
MRFLAVAGLAVAASISLAWMAFAGSGKSLRPGSGNQAPVCCFGPDCQSGPQLATIACTGNETLYLLDASGSYDPEGQPLTFFWQSCPSSTIDDPTAPITLMRLDTTTCDYICPVRLFISDGEMMGHCRVYVTLVAAEGCTYTQGFWKNHGPTGCQSGNNQNEWPVDNLNLGSVNYTDTQLCSIFKTAVMGNGLISLAHQLIAAELNVANGSSVPAQVAGAIADAHLVIGDLVVPPWGTGYISPDAVSGLVGQLTDFNEGLVPGTIHCD